MLRDTRAETKAQAGVLSGGDGAPALKASRRGFLGSAGLAAMGAAIGGAMPFSNSGELIPAASAQGAPAPVPAAPKGPQFLKFPGKNEGLVVLGERPLVAETPESLLDDDTTPTEKFYIRNNGQIPEESKDPDKWKIAIDGEVNKPLEVTLGELKAKYKEPWMTQNAISTYGDMWVIKDALEKAGKADRVAVAEALRTMDAGPSKYYPLGEIKFDEKGRRVGAGMTIVQWQSGVPVTVFPPQLALAQPFWPKN